MREVFGLLLLLRTASAIVYHCGKPVVPPRTRPMAERLSNRIVGGWEAAPHSLPWQVRVMTFQTQTAFFACGGSLIQFTEGNSTDLVLTAAHCFEKNGIYAPVSKIKVLVGAHNLDDHNESFRRTIQALQYKHHDFSDKRKEHDIAVVRLQEAVVYSKATIPVCLPRQNEQLPFGKICFASGWGATSEHGPSSRVLLQVEADVLSFDKCYKSLNKETHFCAGKLAGGKDSCQGDSGGPLVCEVNGRFIQFGIISHGAGCARPGAPGIYTTLPSYIDWLKEQNDIMARSHGFIDPSENELPGESPSGGWRPTSPSNSIRPLLPVGPLVPGQTSRPSWLPNDMPNHISSVGRPSSNRPSFPYGSMLPDLPADMSSIEIGRFLKQWGKKHGSSGTYTLTRTVNGRPKIRKFSF